MKNIVLYTISFMTGLLMISTEMISQKPAIDLLPSSHQRIHPEAIADTSFTSDSQVKIVPVIPPSHKPSSHLIYKETRKNEDKKSWIHFDSIFQREVSRNGRTSNRSGNYSLNFKYINPIKLFLNITALKN